MAGDWIKVEHASLDKPEVLRMAELFGWERHRMIGLLVEFWVWLDRNCHAPVTLLSRKCLDDVTHTPGFASCLEAVGWAEFDDKTGLMTIKNYHRHNGSSAKSRALARDRKVTQRSRERHANNVTREEKRREKQIHIQTQIPKQRPQRASLPADFSISDRVRAWAAAKGYDRLEERFESFVSYAKRSGAVYANWDEAFMGAVRENWAKLAPLPAADSPRRAAL